MHSARADGRINSRVALSVRILFIHQNMPGQFVHLARHFAADHRNKVAFITKRKNVQMPGVLKLEYELAAPKGRIPHQWLINAQNAVVYGEATARAIGTLTKKHRFQPDVVVAHPGWGEALFVKDLLPGVPLLNYIEFFYRAFGADSHFDPNEPVETSEMFRIRIKNTNNLLSLDCCDWGICPTYWQWWQNPREYRSKLSVLHDGINTDVVRPDPEAVFELPGGKKLTRKDPVVTYVARNLEPYRGFPQFIHAIAQVMARRPDVNVLVIGGEQAGYGKKAPEGTTYREMLLKEVALDSSRIHFLGQVPYSAFVKVLQVSSVHVYLTVPFVLSWSMLESMAAECLLVASATPPVLEVAEDGRNALLADFFAPGEIAGRILEALERQEELAPIRKRARETVLERYALNRCLPQHVAIIETLAAGRRPEPARGPAPEVERVFKAASSPATVSARAQRALSQP
jgi:glycosyltransferase involved in cell wall biosynthesis